MKLSYEHIKRFIENYGDGHIYVSHKYLDDGKIVVRFFPNFTKFVDEENIKFLKKEVQEQPNLEEKYVEKIILTPAYAYLPDKKELSGKYDLVKNYKKFLSEMKQLER